MLLNGGENPTLMGDLSLLLSENPWDYDFLSNNIVLQGVDNGLEFV